MLVLMILSQHRVLSSRTIRLRTPCHAQCKLWRKLLRRGLRFVQWRRTRNSGKEQDPIVHGRTELHSTSVQAIELIQSCLGRAHFLFPTPNPNSILTGLVLVNNHGYKSAQPGYSLTVLHVLTNIRPLGETRLARSIQLSIRPKIRQLYIMFWPSTLFSLVDLEV